VDRRLGRGALVAFSAAALLAFGGCGTVLATLPIADETMHEAAIAVPRAGALHVWSLLDAEWIGPMFLRHDLALVDSAGTVVARTTCDPLQIRVKLRSTRVTWRGRHEVHEEGLMDCEILAPAPGRYALRDALTITMVPEALRLTQASIRIRQ
jgi:hypothetical protein